MNLSFGSAGIQCHPKLHPPCSSNTPVQKIIWLRPSYVSITPISPTCKWGITPLPIYVPFRALAVYYRMHSDKCRPHTSPEMRARQLPDSCKGGTLLERKRLEWLLAAPDRGASPLIRNGSCAMSPQSNVMAKTPFMKLWATPREFGFLPWSYIFTGRLN